MDNKKWQVATDIARQIREKKNDIAGNFLWIALQAKKLKDDGTWKAVTEDWDSFCLDNETGLGLSPSYVRNLMSVVKVYIEGHILSVDEAVKVGPHLLQGNKSMLSKIAIADIPKAKEVLLSNGKIADIKRDLRELIPEADRKPLDYEEKFLGALGKAWSSLNDCEMDTVSDDFVKRTQEYLQKISGYLLR